MPDRVGIPPRAAALLLDLTGVLLLAFLFGPWIGIRLGLDTVGGQGPGAGGMMAAGAAGSAVIGLLWFGVEGIWGASPGKRLLRLRIGTEAGERARLRTYALRWALKNAPTLLGLVGVIVSLHLPRLGNGFTLLSYLSGVVILAGCFIAYRSDRQALHDILAGTAVYRAPQPLPPASAPE